MSFYCPICNGLETLDVNCPVCHHPCDDLGRFNDVLAPYSPYRPIDDVKRTNGIRNDFQEHICVHRVHCSHCSQQLNIGIKEWKEL